MPKNRVWEIGDLLEEDFPPIEGFLNGKMLCRGTLSVMSGRRWVGKTWLCMELMRSLALGKPFGPYTTKQARVLLLSQEMGEDELKERFQLLVPTTEVLDLRGRARVLCRESVCVDSDAGSQGLADLLVACDYPEVVIIDNWSFIKGKIKENDNDLVGEGARRLIDGVAVPMGCAVLVTHHFGRQKEDGSYNPRGASALEDMASDLINIGGTREAFKYVGHIEKSRHGRMPDFGYAINDKPEQGDSPIDIYEHKEESRDDATIAAKIIEWATLEVDFDLKKVKEAMEIGQDTAKRVLRTLTELHQLQTGMAEGQKFWYKKKAAQEGGEETPF